MSILIKGMEMPRKCSDCPVLVYGRCLVNDDKDVSDAASDAVQDKDCPLVPVPPHGDLIDRDACIDYIRNNNQHAWEALAYAPTIIPASGGQEDE